MKAFSAALLLALALSASAEPLWVAVGEKSVRMWSRDAIEWKRGTGAAAPSDSLNAVVWGAGKFVATKCDERAGESKRNWQIIVSSDGVRWERHHTTLPL